MTNRIGTLLFGIPTSVNLATMKKFKREIPLNHPKTSPFSVPLRPPGPRLRSTPNAKAFATVRQGAHHED